MSNSIPSTILTLLTSLQGLFNACTDQYGAPPSGWGAQYGGISTDTCSTFPTQLQSGCSFRFGDFFEGADNPTVDWKQVTCPKAITDKTGCVRSGETPTGSGSEGSATKPANTKPAASSTEKASSPAASSPSSVHETPSPSSPAASSPSSTYEAPSPSSPAAPVDTTSSAVDSPPPSYGTTSVGAVSYSSAAAASSSSSAAAPVGTSPSGGLPPYGTGVGPTGTGSLPQPTGGDEQCHIEYVYVDGGSI